MDIEQARKGPKMKVDPRYRHILGKAIAALKEAGADGDNEINGIFLMLVLERITSCLSGQELVEQLSLARDMVGEQLAKADAASRQRHQIP
jgi:hypothetical protein